MEFEFKSVLLLKSIFIKFNFIKIVDLTQKNFKLLKTVTYFLKKSLEIQC